MLELDELMPFYGTGRDELHLAFNFLFVHADLDAAQMRAIVEGVEAGLPPDAWPVYTGSNHDAGRLATRWARGDERRARAALLILLTLRGTPFLYYGDEIALANVPLDPETALDPVARRTGDPADNRDVCRTPMPWTDAARRRLHDARGDAVAAVRRPRSQRRRAAGGPGVDAAPRARPHRAAPRARAISRAGAYATLEAPDGAWAYRRGDGFAVAVNLSDDAVTVGGLEGRVAIATRPRARRRARRAAIELGPWEGVGRRARVAALRCGGAPRPSSVRSRCTSVSSSAERRALELPAQALDDLVVPGVGAQQQVAQGADPHVRLGLRPAPEQPASRSSSTTGTYSSRNHASRPARA